MKQQSKSANLKYLGLLRKKHPDPPPKQNQAVFLGQRCKNIPQNDPSCCFLTMIPEKTNLPFAPCRPVREPDLSQGEVVTSQEKYRTERHRQGITCFKPLLFPHPSVLPLKPNRRRSRNRGMLEIDIIEINCSKISKSCYSFGVLSSLA